MPNASLSNASLRILTIAACAAAARGADAQFTSAIDLSSRSVRPAHGGWQNLLTVSPFVRFDHRSVTIDGRFTALGDEQLALRGFGAVRGTWFSPARAGLQLSVAAFADQTPLQETFSVARAGADARLSYRAGRSGAWLGRELSGDNRPTPVSPVPRLSAGGWRQWGNAVLTFSLSSFASREGTLGTTTRSPVEPPARGPGSFPSGDTLQRVPPAPTVTDTLARFDTVTTARRSWNDAEVAMHWSTGRLAFRGVIGTRVFTERQPNELWGQVEGTVALAPDIAFITASGIHPSNAAYGLPRGRFLQMGFRVAPSALVRPRLPAGVRPVAATFEVRKGDRGQRTLRIRVPSARSVELSADFTDWKPVALTRTDEDRWEVTLPITAGVHRIAIRVDGETWTVPPGVAAVPDEFQGTVGVITVAD